ncbi:MAG: hypothetical protein ACREDR_01910 [Blastocatellia bacterium]
MSVSRCYSGINQVHTTDSAIKSQPTLMSKEFPEPINPDSEIQTIDLEHRLEGLFSTKLEVQGEIDRIEADLDALQRNLESAHQKLQAILLEEQEVKQQLSNISDIDLAQG